MHDPTSYLDVVAVAEPGRPPAVVETYFNMSCCSPEKWSDTLETGQQFYPLGDLLYKNRISPELLLTIVLKTLKNLTTKKSTNGMLPYVESMEDIRARLVETSEGLCGKDGLISVAVVDASRPCENAPWEAVRQTGLIFQEMAKIGGIITCDLLSTDGDCTHPDCAEQRDLLHAVSGVNDDAYSRYPYYSRYDTWLARLRAFCNLRNIKMLKAQKMQIRKHRHLEHQPRICDQEGYWKRVKIAREIAPPVRR
ncbi:hypothetical protein GNI_183610 [Gregarina niphandrodes]|uniref:Uncharacterized protein n=1 Tax=Gregarina niphandrodes TaxID=110365 RepID=A0A023AX69_GRENI|nr:hypothetical protein GNI_183610 [Gregarina niphandrodes]EZG43192.1 hypothetical protein GNI_183610 [Gregarina niphandrodes]|eukprot:XP_011133560.1 hypothetical protein GNI_183610 [Gregarina niphandrodes]